RPLVVGRSTPDVAVTILMKNKWRPQPLRFVSRLYVEVVINRHRRTVIARYEPSDNDGIAGRVDFLSLRAKRAQKLNRCVCAAIDVGPVLRFCADSRDLNPFFE